MEALTASAAASVVIMPDVLNTEIGPTIDELRRLQADIEGAEKVADANTKVAKAVIEEAEKVADAIIKAAKDVSDDTAAKTKTAEARAAVVAAAKNLKKVAADGRTSVATIKKELNKVALEKCMKAAEELELDLPMEVLGEMKVALIALSANVGDNLTDLRKLMEFFCGSDALVAFDVELNQWATDAKVMKYTDGDKEYVLYVTNANENRMVLPNGHHGDESSIPIVVHVNPNPADPSKFDITRVCMQDSLTDHSADVTTPAKLQNALATAFPEIFAENDSGAYSARMFGTLIAHAQELKKSSNPEKIAAGEVMYTEIMSLKGNQKVGKELRNQIKSDEERDIDTPQSVLDAYEETRPKPAPGSMIRRVLEGPLSSEVTQELKVALAIYPDEAVALGDMSDVEKVACIADRRNAERLAAKQAAAKLAADKKAVAKAAKAAAAAKATTEE